MKKPVTFATSLFLLALTAACGDATAPGQTDSAQDQQGRSLPAPDAVLDALSPEARPYGLDVYTSRCASCHGDVGQGIGKAPALRGLTRAAMQEKLTGYRAGETFGAQTPVMAQAIEALSEAEIAAVSIYAGE